MCTFTSYQVQSTEIHMKIIWHNYKREIDWEMFELYDNIVCLIAWLKHNMNYKYIYFFIDWYLILMHWLTAIWNIMYSRVSNNMCQTISIMKSTNMSNI